MTRAGWIRLVLGGALLAGWQTMLLLSEPWIEIDARFALFPAPVPHAYYAMGRGNLQTKARVVEHCRSFARGPDGAVFGEGDGGYYLVPPDGEPQRFPGRQAWQESLRARYGAAAALPALRCPSRWQDRQFVRGQAAWLALAIAFALTALRRRSDAASAR